MDALPGLLAAVPDIEDDEIDEQQANSTTMFTKSAANNELLKEEDLPAGYTRRAAIEGTLTPAARGL